MSELKSSTIEAESESNAIRMQAGSIQAAVTATANSTNLPVIDNLQTASASLSAVNEKYKILLADNAESIKKLVLEFEQFDEKLSEQMGVTEG